MKVRSSLEDNIIKVNLLIKPKHTVSFVTSYFDWKQWNNKTRKGSKLHTIASRSKSDRITRATEYKRILNFHKKTTHNKAQKANNTTKNRKNIYDNLITKQIELNL